MPDLTTHITLGVYFVSCYNEIVAYVNKINISLSQRSIQASQYSVLYGDGFRAWSMGNKSETRKTIRGRTITYL